jgi:hypothetical protein
MTVYYNKLTPNNMANKMLDAEKQLKAREDESLQAFLSDASHCQLESSIAYTDFVSLSAAISQQTPIGWQERYNGLCLVGGNSSDIEEAGRLDGCWNGGGIVSDAKSIPQRVYAPVPHGPENCVRCRFFITDARYLPALVAQFNRLGYQAHLAAKQAMDLESQKDALEDERYFAEESDTVFTNHTNLQRIQTRLEKQLIEADEFAKDWLATFKLISRITELENTRNATDTTDKLVAVGGQEDIKPKIQFVEADSELIYLSMLCNEAELFPDVGDDLLKTPAVEKRSRLLNRILMSKGFAPVFMSMDQNQQLIAGNALIRNMDKFGYAEGKLNGIMKVCNFLEAGEYLKTKNLLSQGLGSLKNSSLKLSLAE